MISFDFLFLLSISFADVCIFLDQFWSGYHEARVSCCGDSERLGRLTVWDLYLLRGGRVKVAYRQVYADSGWSEWEPGPFSSVLCPTQTFILVVSAGVLIIHTPLTLLFPFLCCSSLAYSSCGNLHRPSAGGCQRDRCSVKMHFLQLCPCGWCSNSDLEFPSPRWGAWAVCK